MCGRFTLIATADELAAYFEVIHSIENSPRYNIAPSQPILVVVNDNQQQRHFAHMRWGFVPNWLKEQDINSKWINARAETITEKPLFRKAFQQRRCLIAASGFYEWSQEKKKIPYYFKHSNDEPLAFAGLWETWQNDQGRIIDSCTILTTTANDVVKPIHHRMPVILSKPQFDDWLNTETYDYSKLQSLLQPYANNKISCYQVSNYVNSPQHDAAQCIEPIADNVSSE